MSELTSYERLVINQGTHITLEDAIVHIRKQVPQITKVSVEGYQEYEIDGILYPVGSSITYEFANIRNFKMPLSGEEEMPRIVTVDGIDSVIRRLKRFIEDEKKVTEIE